jgi:hypothetical protein
LSGISFSDPGVDDDPWEVSINWGDGSTNATYATNSQGAQSNQNHAFATPGGYTATVEVTDKDGGMGSNTAQITVEQAYSVQFLRPFDGSTVYSLVTNTMKAGRVVPVKVVVVDDCTGEYVTGISGETVTIDVSQKGGGTIITSDAIEQYVDAGASSGNTVLFRWTADPTVEGGGFWTYNLDSRSLGLLVNTCYRVDVDVDGVRATDDEWALLKPVK